MLLPFEMSSDLSEEAKLVDEIRNIGLKDEGRLTYAEMLMAFRRSQDRVLKMVARVISKLQSLNSSSTFSCLVHHFFVSILLNSAPSKSDQRNQFLCLEGDTFGDLRLFYMVVLFIWTVDHQFVTPVCNTLVLSISLFQHIQTGDSKISDV